MKRMTFIIAFLLITGFILCAVENVNAADINALAQEYNSRGLKIYNKYKYREKNLPYYEQVFSYLDKAIEIDPNFSEAYYNRGNVWSDSGDHLKAIADFNKAIELNPQYAKAFYARCGSWASKKENEKAIDDCTQALEIEPDFVRAYWRRGTIWSVGKKDYVRAVADFKRGLELQPNNTSYKAVLKRHEEMMVRENKK